MPLLYLENISIINFSHIVCFYFAWIALVFCFLLFYKIEFQMIFLGTATVLKYLVKGLEAAEKDYGTEPDAVPVLNYLKGVYEVSHCTDPETVARLIEAHDLCLQHIPSKILKTKEVGFLIILLLKSALLFDILGVLS